MCIIVYKNFDATLPSSEVIKNCFINNPDGAGVAILSPQEKKVRIHKGFMYLKEFQDFIDNNVKENDLAVYHFRITTSGGTCAENCHPFPISNKIEDLKALDIETRFAFIHNGILGQGTKNLSDTQLYIRDKLFKVRESLNNESTRKKIMKQTEGSRTISIDAETSTVFITGEWVKDKEYPGLLFSNDSYLPYMSRLWDKYSFYSTDTTCPYCGEYMEELGSYWGLCECPNCKAVVDDTGKIIIAPNYDNIPF